MFFVCYYHQKLNDSVAKLNIFERQMKLHFYCWKSIDKVIFISYHNRCLCKRNFIYILYCTGIHIYAWGVSYFNITFDIPQRSNIIRQLRNRKNEMYKLIIRIRKTVLHIFLLYTEFKYQKRTKILFRCEISWDFRSDV